MAPRFIPRSVEDFEYPFEGRVKIDRRTERLAHIEERGKASNLSYLFIHIYSDNENVCQHGQDNIFVERREDIGDKKTRAHSRDQALASFLGSHSLWPQWHLTSGPAFWLPGEVAQ